MIIVSFFHNPCHIRLTLICTTFERKKNAHFQRHLGQHLKDSINWAGCQNNLSDVNFYLQKVWNVLIKIQLTKSDPKITRRKKYHPSCQLGLSSLYWMGQIKGGSVSTPGKYIGQPALLGLSILGKFLKDIIISLIQNLPSI